MRSGWARAKSRQLAPPEVVFGYSNHAGRISALEPRAGLIAQIEGKLAQQTALTPLFTIRWRLI